MTGEDQVEFEVDCVEAESPQAILVDIEGTKVWVPKSVIHDDSEVYSKKSGEGGGTLIVERWWAKKRGIEP